MSSTVDEAWMDMMRMEPIQTRGLRSLMNGRLLKPASISSRRNCEKRRSTRSKLTAADPFSDVGQRRDPAASYSSPGRIPLSTSGDLQSARATRSSDIESSTTPSACSVAKSLLAKWQKNKIGAADKDVSMRKAAMRALSEQLCFVEETYRGKALMEHAPTVAATIDTPRAFLEDVMALLMNDLAKTMFIGLADPVEACREAAIRSVTVFVEYVADLTPHLAYLYPVLVARGVPAGTMYDAVLELFIFDIENHAAYKRGRATERQDQRSSLTFNVVEESEELRLSLCRLIGRMLAAVMTRGAVGVLRPYLDETILFLVAQWNDPYAAVKVEALGILTRLAANSQLEQGMKFYAVGLSRAILPHLRHRHAKVRLAAMDALWMVVKVPDRAKVKGAGTAAIVDLVGFREDNVLPVAAFYGRGDKAINYLAELATDQNVSIRTKMITMLRDWLTSLPDRYDHHTRLLPYVLNAISDDTEAVAAIALDAVSKCGAEYEREHQDDVIERRQFGVDGDIRANHAKPLPRPFNGRPRLGARLYIRGNTRRFIMPLLTEMSNWIDRTRMCSAKLFRTIVIYCEEHLTVETHKLLPHLHRALHMAVSAKDERLEDVILDCCELVGRHIVPDSYLPHILPHIIGEPGVNPSGQRSILLQILGKLMEGSAPKTLMPHVPEVVDAVIARHDTVSEECTSTRNASVNALMVLSGAMATCGCPAADEISFERTGRLATLRRPTRCAIAHLLACRSFAQKTVEIDACLSSLTTASNLGSLEDLLARYAGDIVLSLCECRPQLILDALFEVHPRVLPTCPEALATLVHLCKRVTAELDKFSAKGREEVLTGLVGTVVEKTMDAWRHRQSNTRDLNMKLVNAVDEHWPQMMDLCLDACWGTNDLLKKHQLQIIGNLLDDKDGHMSLSSRPEEAETAVRMLGTLAGRVEEHSSSVDDTCAILGHISRLLRRATRAANVDEGSPVLLVPFAKRIGEGTKTPTQLFACGDAIARILKAVLSRLGSEEEPIRHRALESIGDILPFLESDASDTSKYCRKREETGGGAELLCRTGLGFSDFVFACATHAVSANSMSKDIDLFDILLRRTACLDPMTFANVMCRMGEDQLLDQPSRETLSDWADHGKLMKSLQNGAGKHQTCWGPVVGR